MSLNGTLGDCFGNNKVICTYLYLQLEQLYNNDKARENAANSSEVCLQFNFSFGLLNT